MQIAKGSTVGGLDGLDDALLRKLVNSSLNFICVCDKDSVITYVNQSGVKIIKANSAEDILGKSLYEFLHDDYKDFILTGIHDLLESDEILPVRFIDATDEAMYRVKGKGKNDFAFAK